MSMKLPLPFHQQSRRFGHPTGSMGPELTAGPPENGGPLEEEIPFGEQSFSGFMLVFEGAKEVHWSLRSKCKSSIVKTPQSLREILQASYLKNLPPKTNHLPFFFPKHLSFNFFFFEASRNVRGDLRWTRKIAQRKTGAEPLGDELPSLELTANVPEHRQNLKRTCHFPMIFRCYVSFTEGNGFPCDEVYTTWDGLFLNTQKYGIDRLID